MVPVTGPRVAGSLWKRATAARFLAGAWALGAALANPAALTAGPAGINLYGLSHHFDRVYRLGQKFHEVNPGLGVNFVLGHGPRHVVFADLGRYRDSFGRPNTYASLAWTHRIVGPLQGGLLLAVSSGSSVNDGEPFLAPVPMLSCRSDRAAVHLLYLARFSEISDFPSLAAYATVYPFAPARPVLPAHGAAHGHVQTGLQFAAGSRFTLEGWGDATLALRRRGVRRDWRIAVDLEALAKRQTLLFPGNRSRMESVRRFDLELRAERFRRAPGPGTFSLLLGAGPILGYTNRSPDRAMRVWRVGAAGTCGVEWRAAARLSLSAEQGLDLTLESGRSEENRGAGSVESSLARWTAAARPVRLGVTAWFE